jgi:hypothetical protein
MLDPILTVLGNRLATVNFFLGVVGVVQVSRILMYNAEQKKKGALGQKVEEVKEDVKAAVSS